MTPATKPETFGASDFKARCLKILDEVAETGRPVTVARHGKAVARLVPTEAERTPLKARTLGDIVTSDRDNWDEHEIIREWDELMAQGDVQLFLLDTPVTWWFLAEPEPTA